jgi:hypothetical protein
LAAKGKEKEGHFWCKEEIDLDLQKIKNQSWKGKKKKTEAWLGGLIHGFISFASSSWLRLPPLPPLFLVRIIPFTSHHDIVWA